MVSSPSPPLRIFSSSSPSKVSSPLPPITSSISTILSVVELFPSSLITLSFAKSTVID